MRTSTATSHSTISLLILSILSQGDMYGYQIVQTLKEKSKGYYVLRESSMYPTLYRLLEEGFISTSKECIVQKRVRVYYHIEEKGFDYLKELEKNYFDATIGVCSVLDYKVSFEYVKPEEAEVTEPAQEEIPQE